MASGFYTAGLTAIMNGNLSLLTDTIKVTLIDTGYYTANLSTHDNYDDVPSAARVSAATLVSKTISGGAFDAADTTFSAVTGATCEALIIWKDSGAENSSTLIAYIDTATGLPTVALTNNTVVVAWNNGGSKIFKLS
jgi:hypothetical protein